MTKKYPKTIAAIGAAIENENKGLWEIGDALVAETGQKPITKKLEDALVAETGRKPITKKLEYPKSVAAIRAAIKSKTEGQWKIGDALVAEIGPYGGSYEKVVDAMYLAKNIFGLSRLENYSPRYLQQLRFVSTRFPKNRRHNLEWKIHLIAKHPDTLNEAIELNKIENGTKPLTRKYLKKYIQKIWET
jgi:hypothetical protein